MATDAQVEANRTNAAKSTGPRTRAGKRRAAANARKHGLSMRPPSERVLDWYRRIVCGLNVDPGSPQDRALRDAAMALAEAEAGLERVRDAEEDFLHDLSEDRHLHIHLRTTTWTTRHIRRIIPSTSSGGQRNLLDRRDLATEEIHHKITEKWTEPHVKHARLVRYRRDAEVRRHKALQAWIKELRKRFFRNEPNFGLRL